MANYQNLKDAVAQIIKNNGNNEITGDLLQNTLISMISNLGKYSTFVGGVNVSSVPGSEDGNVFYVPTETGIYPNFGGITIDLGLEVAIINRTSTGFSKISIPIPLSGKMDISAATMNDTNSPYDSRSIVIGEYVQNGNILVGENYVRSKPIRLKDGATRVYFNRNRQVGTWGCFFDKNMKFIPPNVNFNGLTGNIEIPLGAAFVIVNVSNNLPTHSLDIENFRLSYTSVLGMFGSTAYIDSLFGMPTQKPKFFPFSDGMIKAVDKNMIGTIVELRLFGVDPALPLYIKQIGRNAAPTTETTNRYYLEIWNNDTNSIAFGADNPTGRWTRPGEDFKGIESKDIYDQSGNIVGFVVFNWANAWNTDPGGWWGNGTFLNAALSKEVFYSIPISLNEYPYKKWETNGDSIMAAANSFIILAANQLKVDSIVNHAIGGSTIAQRPSEPTTRNPIVIRYVNMNDDADLVIIAAGTNDWNYTWTPVGEFTDRRVDTFYGALHLLCEGLLLKYPGKRIMFQTPIKRNFEQNQTPETVNGNGKTLQEYADIIIEVCGYWGIPVLDMFRECTLNPFLPYYISNYIPDGTHPNSAGHVILKDRVVGYLKQL